MSSNKKYRLLKDLPEVKAGTILTEDYGDDTYNYNSDNGEVCRYRRYSVENNPEWFELVEDTDTCVVESVDSFTIKIFSRKGIDRKHFDEIKEAVECIINKTTWLKEYEKYRDKKLIEDAINFIFPESAKKYTEKELLEAEERAFDAGQQPECSGTLYYGLKYSSFSDYKNKTNESR